MTMELFSSVYDGVNKAVSAIKQSLQNAMEAQSNEVDAFCAGKSHEDILKALLGEEVSLKAFKLPIEKSKNAAQVIQLNPNLELHIIKNHTEQWIYLRLDGEPSTFLAEVVSERIKNYTSLLAANLQSLQEDESNIFVTAANANTTLKRLQELRTLITTLEAKIPNVMSHTSVETNIEALLKGASCLEGAITAARNSQENSNSD